MFENLEIFVLFNFNFQYVGALKLEIQPTLCKFIKLLKFFHSKGRI